MINTPIPSSIEAEFKKKKMNIKKIRDDYKKAHGGDPKSAAAKAKAKAGAERERGRSATRKKEEQAEERERSQSCAAATKAGNIVENNDPADNTCFLYHAGTCPPQDKTKCKNGRHISIEKYQAERKAFKEACAASLKKITQ